MTPGCNDTNCCFAHTQNELLYHPFNFKIKLCRDYLLGNCDILLCPNSHDYLTDFRTIYNTSDPKIKNIIEQTQGMYLIRPFITDNRYITPEEFNPTTYKVSKCPLEEYCKSSQCLLYHSRKEQRRCPKTYFYFNTPCPKVFIEGVWNEPDKCVAVSSFI
jgi:hypothetical protein